MPAAATSIRTLTLADLSCELADSHPLESAGESGNEGECTAGRWDGGDGGAVFAGAFDDSDAHPQEGAGKDTDGATEKDVLALAGR